MIKLVELDKPPVEMTAALAIIEDLKQSVLSGKIKAFIGVGVAEDHTVLQWATSTKSTTRLELMGAIAALQSNFHADV